VVFWLSTGAGTVSGRLGALADAEIDSSDAAATASATLYFLEEVSARMTVNGHGSAEVALARVPIDHDR